MRYSISRELSQSRRFRTRNWKNRWYPYRQIRILRTSALHLSERIFITGKILLWIRWNFLLWQANVSKAWLPSGMQQTGFWNGSWKNAVMKRLPAYRLNWTGFMTALLQSMDYSAAMRIKERSAWTAAIAFWLPLNFWTKRASWSGKQTYLRKGRSAGQNR